MQISDNFAKLSESLYVAERSARDEVDKRAQIQKRIAAKDKESKEEDLRALAQRAREERATATLAPPPAHGDDDDDAGGNYGLSGLGGGNGGADDDAEGVAERDELRNERKRERERERRLENRDGKRSKMTRDGERDVSERIALGQAVPSSTEVLFDQRLFNQSSGLTSGLGGSDDAYNVYDKALFRGSGAADAIYRPTKAHDDGWGDEDEAAAKVSAAARFKPGDRGFDGAKEQAAGDGGGRGRPVEFEQEAANDPFGLDDFLDKADKAK